MNLSCLFSHGDMIRIRDEHQRLALQCVDCGHVKVVLEGAVVKKGPQHNPADVLGKPTCKVIPLARKADRFPRRA